MKRFPSNAVFALDEISTEQGNSCWHCQVSLGWRVALLQCLEMGQTPLFSPGYRFPSPGSLGLWEGQRKCLAVPAQSQALPPLPRHDGCCFTQAEDMKIKYISACGTGLMQVTTAPNVDLGHFSELCIKAAPQKLVWLCLHLRPSDLPFDSSFEVTHKILMQSPTLVKDWQLILSLSSHSLCIPL